MKIAVTIWNERISPVLDVAREVLVLDVENRSIVGRQKEKLPGTEPWAQVERIVALGPHVLICGAISQPMVALLTSAGIRIVPFTAGDVEEVVAAWLAHTLPSPALCMPGCCGRMRRLCRGTKGGRRGRGGR